MRETGVVIDKGGNPIFWHLPNDRTAGNIPCTKTLWEVLWENHNLGILWGFAHSHPGGGKPGPSPMDLTTFIAIENALGRLLEWWIVNDDMLVRCHRMNDEPPYQYGVLPISDEPSWAVDLRNISAAT